MGFVLKRCGGCGCEVGVNELEIGAPGGEDANELEVVSVHVIGLEVRASDAPPWN